MAKKRGTSRSSAPERDPGSATSRKRRWSAKTINKAGRLLTAQRSKLRRLKADFDHADAEGRAALEEGDLGKLGDAINREREVIEKQSAIIKAQIQATRKRKRR